MLNVAAIMSGAAGGQEHRTQSSQNVVQVELGADRCFSANPEKIEDGRPGLLLSGLSC